MRYTEHREDLVPNPQIHSSVAHTNDSSLCHSDDESSEKRASSTGSEIPHMGLRWFDFMGGFANHMVMYTHHFENVSV